MELIRYEPGYASRNGRQYFRVELSDGEKLYSFGVTSDANASEAKLREDAIRELKLIQNMAIQRGLTDTDRPAR